MTIETKCPPHLAALDNRGVLVCTLCKRRLEEPCLACVVEHDGLFAQHVCDDFTRDELMIAPAIFVLIVLTVALVAAVSGAS